jgi:hypothetical protein
MRRLAPVLIAALALVSCGGTAAAPEAGSPQERFWADQALDFLDGLDQALTRIGDAGVGRSALRDGPYLYSALLGYTYVAGCGEVLSRLGQPSRRQREARRQIYDACRR